MQISEGTGEQLNRADSSTPESSVPSMEGAGRNTGVSLTFDLQPLAGNNGARCFGDGCHADAITGVSGLMHQPFAQGLCDDSHAVSESPPKDRGAHVA